MSPTALAPLARAPRGLVVGPDLIGAAQHLERFGRPKREAVDRSGRPAPARLAVAVAHGGWRARDAKRHSSTEAGSQVGSFVAHTLFLSLASKSTRAAGLEHDLE